ncbi:MAG: hypothetical protein LUO93_03035 [Methanomicrobiales archaeon]|nr:hypothetical protein [Methanomicrobiales archaeon]
MGDGVSRIRNEPKHGPTHPERRERREQFLVGNHLIGDICSRIRHERHVANARILRAHYVKHERAIGSHPKTSSAYVNAQVLILPKSLDEWQYVPRVAKQRSTKCNAEHVNITNGPHVPEWRSPRVDGSQAAVAHVAPRRLCSTPNL